MTAGLPGTGIGGLFYILLSGLMPFFHIVRMFRGTHKLHHLKTAVSSILLSAGILLALFGEAKLLVWLANKFHFLNMPDDKTFFGFVHFSEGSVLSAISPALASLPFIILFTVLIGIQILRLIVHGYNRKPRSLQKSCTLRLHEETSA